MEAEIYTNLEEIEHCWPDKDTVATPFQTYIWHQLWIKHFGGNLSLHLIIYKDKDTTLAIFPLYKQNETLQFIGMPPNVSDYFDIIWLTTNQEKQQEVIFHFLKNHQGYTLNLMHLPENSITYELLKKETDIETELVPLLSLPKTWDEYLTNLGRKNRHELRRKLKKLDAVSFGTQYFSRPEEINQEIDVFIELMRSSSPEKEQFMTTKKADFFRAFAVKMAEEKMIILSFLIVEDKRVATTLHFRHRNKLLLYNSGYNPKYKELGPGFLLTALNIKYGIEKQYKEFNFLRGNERYKYQLGGTDTSIYNVRITTS